jgi:hypothetical protein
MAFSDDVEKFHDIGVGMRKWMNGDSLAIISLNNKIVMLL